MPRGAGDQDNGYRFPRTARHPGHCLLIFGAKKLRNIGSDLGSAVKGFKKAMNEGDTEEGTKQLNQEQRPDADFNTTKQPDTTKDTKSV